ncbi:MAG: hypothetical protein U1F11_15045 [Steroidobacteraceae bacterium]
MPAEALIWLPPPTAGSGPMPSHGRCDAERRARERRLGPGGAPDREHLHADRLVGRAEIAIEPQRETAAESDTPSATGPGTTLLPAAGDWSITWPAGTSVL